MGEQEQYDGRCPHCHSNNIDETKGDVDEGYRSFTCGDCLTVWDEHLFAIGPYNVILPEGHARTSSAVNWDKAVFPNDDNTAPVMLQELRDAIAAAENTPEKPKKEEKAADPPPQCPRCGATEEVQNIHGAWGFHCGDCGHGWYDAPKAEPQVTDQAAHQQLTALCKICEDIYGILIGIAAKRT